MRKWFNVGMFQFPMGTVKGKKGIKSHTNFKFQFPMGTVKLFMEGITDYLTFQFPMGTVKNNILCSDFIIFR